MIRQCIILAIWFVVSVPGICHAYLDPGSGNALIYMAISLAGASAYFLKNVGYKLLGAISGKSYAASSSGMAADEEIVIFSEGKTYWYTFKPIIDAFIAKGQQIGYLSMDVEDPCLAIENELINSRYVGSGSGGFARISASSAKVMITTTPNIGTDGYPLPRPKKVCCLAHVFHSVNDIGVYKRGSLDNYDAALMPGKFVLPSIRALEQKRGLSEKECPVAGLPYLDELVLNTESDGDKDGQTILIAPSWGEKNCLAIYGTKFISLLAAAGYAVIIRPHPYSKKFEPDFIERIDKEIAIKYVNVSLDTELDSRRSMQQADLLISDKSGIRFDFAFLYERPVLTLDIPSGNMSCFEAGDLDEVPWEERVSHRLGERLTLDALPAGEDERARAIFEAAVRALNTRPSDIKEFRAETIANFGHSGEHIAEWAIAKKDYLNAIRAEQDSNAK